MQLSSERETEAEPFESALRNENKSKSIPGEEPWKGRGVRACPPTANLLEWGHAKCVGPTRELGGNPWRQERPQMLGAGVGFPLCSAGAGEPPQSLAGGQARFCPL